MKANLVLLLIIFSTSNIFAQTDNLTFQKEIEILNNKIVSLETSIEKLEIANNKLSGQLNIVNSNIQKLSASTDSIKILKDNLANTDSNLHKVAENLGVQIQQTIEKTNADLSNLSDTVSKNTLYWIIAVLLIALLSVLLFGWLKKQLGIEKTGLSDQIKKTSETLHDEQLKLDEQLIKLLDTQMQLMKEDRQVSSTKSEEVDHSLALKVADEIIRIKKNLSNMDSETKGLKQLLASVERIQDNFKANGYEMIDMLNKPFDQGMKLTPSFRPDEKLKKGEQIITRIIKPQVNYKSVMIQAAQVEVSVGE
jgi:predicted  nucleic acid-binding Zn-ribbon protein